MSFESVESGCDFLGFQLNFLLGNLRHEEAVETHGIYYAHTRNFKADYVGRGVKAVVKSVTTLWVQGLSTRRHEHQIGLLSQYEKHIPVSCRRSRYRILSGRSCSKFFYMLVVRQVEGDWRVAQAEEAMAVQLSLPTANIKFQTLGLPPPVPRLKRHNPSSLKVRQRLSQRVKERLRREAAKLISPVDDDIQQSIPNSVNKS